MDGVRAGRERRCSDNCDAVVSPGCGGPAPLLAGCGVWGRTDDVAALDRASFGLVSECLEEARAPASWSPVKRSGLREDRTPSRRNPSRGGWHPGDAKCSFEGATNGWTEAFPFDLRSR